MAPETGFARPSLAGGSTVALLTLDASNRCVSRVLVFIYVSGNEVEKADAVTVNVI